MDYSGRAVIAPGPRLEPDECGLPRSIARSLFEPLVAGALLRAGEAESEAVALRMIEECSPLAERRLEQVAASRLVLLHRAPVLHRWGIQAFRPLLTDEQVLRIHPLTNVGFNADFDGDALEVFLPLSAEAQQEAEAMLPTANQVGSAAGTYTIGPTQEMALGCHWATAPGKAGEGDSFASADAVATAFDRGELRTHDPVRLEEGDATRITTVGRVLFNQLLPAGVGWIDGALGRRDLEELLMDCWRSHGAEVAARLANELMCFGFRMMTRSGLSIGVETQSQYSGYDRALAEAWQRADELASGEGDGEGKVIEHWLQVSSRMTEEALDEHSRKEDGLNATYLMMRSGARGNAEQLRQQLALRGLFSRPDGGLYSVPCTTTFVRGQSPLEFFAGVEGARRGLCDTQLKCSVAGFLFKRIMSAVQDVLIGEEDCGTDRGLTKQALADESGVLRSLADRIAGRFTLKEIVLPGDETPLVSAGELIDREEADRIEAAGVTSVAVRSVVTCRSGEGVCSRCYGVNLSTWQRATLQLPVGVIAAQSLGEPLTQLTMRVFSLSAPRRDRVPAGTIISSLPGLEELYEAGQLPGRPPSELRATLNAKLEKEGAVPTCSHLLETMLTHYRTMGVPIDDIHLEVVIGQMVRDGEAAKPTLLGVTEVARRGADFMTAAASYDGVRALARAAAEARRMGLNAVGSSTAFGKLMPARVPDPAVGVSA